MNKGVEILLARMESNPEEFAIRMNYGESQWSGLINMFKHCLDQEDIDALEAGAKKCNQEMFTRKVMEALLDPKSEDGVSLYNITHPSITRLGGATQGLYSNGTGGNATLTTGTVTLPSGSITLGDTTLEEETLKHMKAHVEYLNKQKRNEAKKEAQKQQTLVGKLYNYLGTNK